MVTTLVEIVAKACSHGRVYGGQIYMMEPLTLEQSKQLFLTIAFGSQRATCPGELKDDMDNILKKCGGIPMAVVSIASLLESSGWSRSKNMWERICISIGFQMEYNTTLEAMMQILTVSYNHLPHCLKDCLMYLSMFDSEEHKLLDRLGEFTLLRMLDLEGCKGVENKHMRAICRMYLLRYLGLKGTDISEMPRQVSNLEHLQTLDVSQTRLSRLPETVTELRKVERLKFSHKEPGNCATMWKPPRGFSEMKALREVGNVIVDTVHAARDIGELEQLQAIDVYVDGSSQHKEMLRQELALSLSKMYSLRSLNVGDIVDDGHTLDYLMNLHSPPRLLRYLRLSGNIARLPDWLGSLTYLAEVAISSTKLAGGDQLFHILCKAPSLHSVLFDKSFYTGHHLVARTAHNFLALKAMRVPSYDKWPKVFEFQEGSMPTLEILEVNFGGNREKSIVGIEHLTNLKEVQLRGEEGNPALNHALEQIKAERGRRAEHNKFRVRVGYL